MGDNRGWGREPNPWAEDDDRAESYQPCDDPIDDYYPPADRTRPQDSGEYGTAGYGGGQQHYDGQHYGTGQYDTGQYDARQFDQPSQGGPQDGGWAPAPVPAPGRRTGLVIAAMIVGLLVVGGVVGYLLLGRDSPGTGTAGPAATGAGTSGTPSGSAASGSPSTGPLPLNATAVGQRPGQVATPGTWSASCESPSSVDDAGNTTTFGPGNAFDEDPSTAWRCAGAGGGELRFEFDQPTEVNGIGLIPGYAKVDPSTGVDRFGQNHTVTEATWRLTLADGQHLSITQQIPNPGPDPQWLKLSAPQKVTGGTLTVVSTGNPGAERDYTPVSEVTLTRP